jgi:SAM-dependent methyltransferase
MAALGPAPVFSGAQPVAAVGELLMSAMLRIAVESVEHTGPESREFESRLALDHSDMLELGCGRADLTRQIANGGVNRRVTATEVDEIQHALNLKLDLPNVSFKLAGAQAIPAADASIDTVFMFKSLHHVPVELMPVALTEVARVLKPGGHAWVSEPVFAGPFNDILQLFHNEQRVRAAAFAAISAAVDSGLLLSAEEIFFNQPMFFADFEAFERQVIGVTHTRHVLSPATHAEVKALFNAHQQGQGVHFRQPLRVNLLRKPA